MPDIVVRIGSDGKAFETGLKNDVDRALASTGKNVAELGSAMSKAIDGPLSGISASFGKIASAASLPTKAVGGLTDVLGKVGLAALGFKAVIGGVAAVATGMVSGNAEMETYETQLGTLLGSADAAKDRLKELAEFGAKTPFELPEVVRAEKVLLGFGLTGQKAVQMTGKSGTELRTIIGDIAAGTGASFEEMALNFGKFSAGATGEAISRFQEMGIVTREQLTAMGIQFSKSGELISPLPEAMAAAVKIAQSKFGGGMDKLSATFEGQMSTLADNFNAVKRAVMAPIFDVLKDSVARINDFLSTGAFQEGLRSVAELMTGAVKQGVDAARIAFSLLMDIVGEGGDLGVFADDIRELTGIDLGPIVQIQRALEGLITVVGDLLRGDFKQAWADFQTTIANLGAVILPLLQDFGGRVLAWVLETAPKIGTQLLEWGKALVGWVAPQISPLLTALGGLAGRALTWITEQAPVVLAQLGAWKDAFLNWVGPLVAQIPGKLGEFRDAAFKWIGSVAPTVLAKLGEWGQAFLDWVIPLVKSLPAKMDAIRDAAWAWIGDAAPKLLAKLGEWKDSFLGWVTPLVQAIPGKLGEFKDAVWTWITETAPKVLAKLTEWKDAFLNWVGPLVTALPTELGKVKDTITMWVTATAVPAIDKAWQGLSPVIVPTITKALEDAREKLKPIWTEITTFMADFEPTGKRLETLFGTIGNVLKDPVAPALQAVAEKFGVLFGKVGLLLGGEGGGKGPNLLKMIADDVNAWSAGAQAAATGIGKVAEAIKAMYEWIDTLIKRLGGKSLWETIWGATPLGALEKLLDVLIAARGAVPAAGSAATGAPAQASLPAGWSWTNPAGRTLAQVNPSTPNPGDYGYNPRTGTFERIPGRALGGDVLGGKPYWVGERGRELFVPDQPGSVVPNGAARTGGIDYERLAQAVARAMANVNLSVAVDDIHGGLLRKQARNAGLGLA